MSKIRNPLSQNRIDLCKSIPLEQPIKVCIDPADICNFKCDFCGLHNKRNVQYAGSVMSLDLFEVVLNQLSDFSSPIKQIHLYALGEPLLNPHITDFVRMIKERKAADSRWLCNRI